MSTTDDREPIELLQGTMDRLTLRMVLRGPVHGHAIAKATKFDSDEVLQVEQGSLYRAPHRRIKRGWVAEGEDTSENNRRAKFYPLTARGRKLLKLETGKWDKRARAIARMVRSAE